MARFHHGLITFLQHELPEAEQDVIRDLFEQAKGSVDAAEQLSAMLFSLAASSERRLEPAIARFALYQLLRVSVWIGTWHVAEAAELEATGVLLELDDRAERRLRARLRIEAMRAHDVRPVSILLAELFETLQDTLVERRQQIREEGAQFMRLMERMIKATAAARTMDDGDAVLLRNEIDATLGRDALRTITLVERHHDALPSIGAAKTRRRRLKSRLAKGETNAPRQRRVIDTISDCVRDLERL